MSSYWADPVDSASDISHYGIKGMKWGVRKKSHSIHKGRKKRPNASKDYARSARLSRKKIYELSNDDLAFMKKRLNAEREYKKALKDNESIGKKFASALKDKSVETLASAAIGLGTGLAFAYAAKYTPIGPYLPNVKGVKGPNQQNAPKVKAPQKPRVIKVIKRTNP